MGRIYDLSIDVDVKSEEGEQEQNMKAKNGTHGTHASSGGQMEVIEPEIAGTHGTHGTLVGIDRHTLSQDSEQEQNKDPTSITEKIVTQESSKPSETTERDQQGGNNTIHANIPNLEPEVHSECPIEAPKQQQQNKSFNCFYCSKSHSTNKERITHINYEHPGKIYYPTPEDFENRLNK
jgi:hypothetical protein